MLSLSLMCQLTIDRGEERKDPTKKEKERQAPRIDESGDNGYCVQVEIVAESCTANFLLSSTITFFLCDLDMVTMMT